MIFTGNNPLYLLEEAQAYCMRDDWARAKAKATEAIRLKPDLTDAYMIRALALRLENNLDGSMEDYARVIEVDPQNAEAWMFRGACVAQKASQSNNPNEVSELLEEAHRCYRKSAELRPDEEQAGLALLELEICIGKYREAVGTTGIWWNRIQIPQNKMLCAWLGSLAFILAGKREAKWSHLLEFLEKDTTRLDPNAWSVAEISQAINKLRDTKALPDAKMFAIAMVHQKFLSHFAKGGPAIR